MPLFVQIKQQDVKSKVEEELMSSDESVYDLLSLEDSDASSDDDVRSLSPEEIIVSSDGSDDEESIPHPPDSNVSISSDEIKLLDETSSESDAEINYEVKLNKYHSYQHYTHLKGHIVKKRLPAPVTSIKEQFTAADTVDEVARFFYPPDSPVGYFPTYTGGDGNCLPQALSHLFFGNEDHHFEVRCRIIEAGVLNEEDFISHQMLTQGVMNGSKNRPQQYAMYSPKLLPRHRRLDCDEIRDVYQAEIMAITREL